MWRTYVSDITHRLEGASSTQHQIIFCYFNQHFVIVLAVLFRSATVYAVLVRTVTVHWYL